MPDYASLLSGASVAYGPLVGEDGREGKLTSPTLAASALPWADYVLHWLRVPGRVYAEDGDAALSLSSSLGSCFAFQGGEGRLTVRLARAPPPQPTVAAVAAAAAASAARMLGVGNPSSSSSSSVGVREHGHSRASGGIDAAGAAEAEAEAEGGGAGWAALAGSGFVKVTHVSIEHARTAAAPTAVRSAPRAFRVMGWDADPTAHGWAVPGGGGVESASVSASLKFSREEEEEVAVAAASTLTPYVLVEGAEFLVGEGAPGVQTFAVSEESREGAPPVGWVTLEVESNHGGRWTCLYGFRVHGHPVATA